MFESFVSLVIGGETRFDAIVWVLVSDFGDGGGDRFELAWSSSFLHKKSIYNHLR